MKTRTDIHYHSSTGLKTIIPKGTRVIPATKDVYWAEPWPSMDEFEESYGRCYGFLLTLDEVQGKA